MNSQTQSFEEFRDFAEAAVDAWTADGWDPQAISRCLDAAYQRYLNASRNTGVSTRRNTNYGADYDADCDYSRVGAQL